MINFVKGINFANSLCHNLIRENNHKLVREISKKGQYGYQFLTNRAVESWNKLPKEAISARTVNSFKAIIDKEIFKQNSQGLQ